MAEEAVSEDQLETEEQVVQEASPPVAEPAPAAKKAQKTDEAGRKQASAHLMKVWYASMVFCILGLATIGFLFQDESVFFYVFLGVVTLCVTPVIRLFKAMGDLKRLNELNAAIEQKRQEELARKKTDRLANMTFEEIQELERQKAMATSELAKRHAAKDGAPAQEPSQEVPINV